MKSAIGAQHGGDGFAQENCAARVAVAEAVGLRIFQQGASICSSNHIGWHQPRVRRAVVERQHVRFRAEIWQVGRGAAEREILLWPARQLRGWGWFDVRQQGGDECAARRLGCQPALRDQFVVGLLYGFTIYADFGREFAGAGQRAAGGEPAAADCLDQGAGDLQIGGLRGVAQQDDA